MFFDEKLPQRSRFQLKLQAEKKVPGFNDLLAPLLARIGQDGVGEELVCCGKNRVLDHELSRTVTPFLLSHFKVVHQFFFQSWVFNHVFGMLFHHRCTDRIWTNGDNPQLWWRTRCQQQPQQIIGTAGVCQDRTAECPICFETLWTATPTAFVKLVEGARISFILDLMISPQHMLCLAPCFWQ